MAKTSADNAHMLEPSLTELVSAAVAGDHDAWEMIVDRMNDMVWSCVRSFRLSEPESEDAAQMVWLRVLERLHKVHDPERLGLWIATIARRECMRLIEKEGRLVPTDPAIGFATLYAAGDIEAEQCDRDTAGRIIAALNSLSPDCQSLLRLLLCDPPMSYKEISATLGIAVGTIGARRQRSLVHLRSAAKL